ncbi:MAG: hypothetical protein AB7O24_01890 [Kofleriaceae bacterium]
MRAVVILVILVILMNTVRIVDAKCKSPSVAMSPASGPLPPRPTLYLFDVEHVPEGEIDDRLSVRIAEQHQLVELDASQVTNTPAFNVYRIDLGELPPGKTLTVSWNDHVIGDYQITAAGHPNMAAITSVKELRHRWSCSHTQAIRVGVEGNAAAFQITWEDGELTVVPGVMWGGESNPADAWFELGYSSCLGAALDEKRLANLRGFTVHALFADGSSLPLGASAAQIDDDRVRLPVELVGKLPGDSLNQRSHVSMVSGVTSEALAACVAAAGAISTLMTALLLRSRRRRRSHAPRF